MFPEWAAAFVAPEIDAALDAPPHERAAREQQFRIRYRNGLLGLSADELWRRNLDRRLAAVVAKQAATTSARRDSLVKARAKRNAPRDRLRDEVIAPEVLRLLKKNPYMSNQQIARAVTAVLAKKGRTLPEDDSLRMLIADGVSRKVVARIRRNPALLKQNGQ